MNCKHLNIPLTGFKISIALLFTVIFSAITIVSTEAYCQIGIGTTAPDPKAVLEVSSNNKGMLIPRMTKVQLESINDPPIGLMVYVTNAVLIFEGGTFYINGLEFYYPSIYSGALCAFNGYEWRLIKTKKL